jgi:hypothetical protein
MGARRSIVVFRQDDLELIGFYPSTAVAAKELLGDARKNANIGKYLSGKIQNLLGMVWIDIDLSKGLAMVDVEDLKVTARRRRDRSSLFLINNDLIDRLSNEDVVKITEILSKYIKT